MSLNPYDDALTSLDDQQGQAPSPANPYLDTLDEIDTSKTRALRTSLAQAAAQSPDRAAEARKLSDQTGVPYDVVDRNFDAIKKRAAAEDSQAATLLRDSPQVAEWASTPQNAAVAHDDLPSLSALEQTLRMGRNVVGALGAGVMDFSQGVYGAVQAGAEVVQGISDTAIGARNVFAHPWQSLVRTSYWAAGKGAPDQPSGLAAFATGAAAVAGTLADRSRGGPSQLPVAGQVTPGNVDLYQQPRVKNADGSISTVDSLSVNMDGTEVLLPTVTPDGRHFTGTDAEKAAQAVAEYQKTGRHLGIFDTPEAADAYAQRLHEEYAKGLYDAPAPGFIERSIYGGIESAGNMIPTLVAGLVLGPEALLGAIGVTTGGQSYSQARAQGLDVGSSAVMGAIQGTVEVATEFIPAHRLLGDLATKAPLWKTLAHQMASEIPGEEVATILQDLNEWAFLPANKDRTFGDYLQERPSAAAATLISVVVGTGLQTVATHGTVRMLERLGDTVAESKTAQRSPDAVESFIAQAVKDGGTETLYQPIDTWQEYWQSKGVDPAQAAVDVLGSRTSYDEAVRLGTDLAIPTAKYAVKLAGTEHNAFFAQELRPAPDVMNGREAKAFETEQAKALEDVSRGGNNITPDLTPAQQVRAQVIEQLVGAGIQTKTAETYAALYEGAFGSMAQRAGLNPAELYAQYGLTVQRPDLAQPSAPASAKTTPTAAVAPVPIAAPLAPNAAVEAPPIQDMAALLAEANARADAAAALAASETKRADTDHLTGIPNLRVWDSAKPGTATPGRTIFRVDMDNFKAVNDTRGHDAGNRAIQIVGHVIGSFARRQGDIAARVGGDEFGLNLEAGGDETVHAALRDQMEAAVQAALDAAGFSETGASIGFGSTNETADVAATARKKEKGVSRPRAVIDTTAGRAETTTSDGHQTTTGPQLPGADQESRALAEARDAARRGEDARADARATEDLPPSTRDAFRQLAADARANGYIGSSDSLASLFADKYAAAQRIAADLEETVNDTSWRTMLVAIANAGGIGLDAEANGGYSGEVRWLLESLSGRGPGIVKQAKATRRGQATVGRTMPLNSAGLKGSPRVILGKGQGGKSLDTIREHLQQEPRWSHLVDLTTFMTELEAAVNLGYQENTGGTPSLGNSPDTWSTLDGLLEVREGSRWWQEAQDHAVDDHANGSDDGDVSFNPAEFFQSLFDLPLVPQADTLDTGEQQPRLPGDVGAVREQDVSTPAFEVPFALTAEVSKAKTGTQRTLFQSDRAIVGEDGYQRDLFGAPTQGPVQSDANAAAADRHVDPARALQRDDAAGDFWTRTQLTTDKTRTLGATHVTTPADAAQALAYLATGAQERVDVLVTSADGTPLAVVGSFKGMINGAAVHPGIVTAEAFRIRGAAAVWIAHNHPSGESGLSREDRTLGARMAEAFRGSEIAMRGILAIGSGEDGARRFSFADPARGDEESGIVARAEDGPSVPVVERELVKTGKIETPINAPEDAVVVTPVVSRGQFGAVLLDAKNRPIGFAPFDSTDAATLRTGGRLDALYRALSVSAPASAIVSHTGPGSLEAAWNLAAALESVDVQVLDLVGPDASGTTVSTRLTSVVNVPKQFRQEHRGSLRIGADRQMTVTLFEHADLTTVIHEGAHLFLEVLQDLAARPNANPQIKADLEILRTWAADPAHSSPRFSEYQHEQIARGFEAYVMEGRAPSPELRSAFSRMRAWMLGIYRQLTNLHVHLNPDVRAVFDRLLATDHAIAEAQASGHVTPIFTTPESAGMTAEQFALYRDHIAAASRTATERLDRQLMAEVQRQQSEQYAAQRALVEADVTAKVQAEPVYLALADLQRGTLPNGSPIVEGRDVVPASDRKLSKDILVDRYGTDRLKRLPKPYIYTREGGLDPEIVAELYGFSSGDHLLTAIEQAAPIRAVIQQETDRRMAAEYPSILLDGSMHGRAKEALANEDAEVVVRAELKALADLERTVAPHVRAERQATRAGLQSVRAAIPPEDLLRAQARAMVAGTRVRDLKPQAYWVAGRKAARQAIEHISRQDYPAAIAAKQQELLNLAIYREALRAKEDALDRVRAAKALGKPAARQRLGKAGEAYLDQVDGILDRFEFAAVSQKVLDRRASLRKFLAALEGQGLPVPDDLPDSLLDESRRVNWQELTVDELVGVTDGLTQIAHLARLKNRLLKSADTRDFDEVRDALASSILEHNTLKPVSTEIRPGDETWRKVAGWFASHAKIAILARTLDGHQDAGPMWEHLIRPLNEAADAEAVRFRDVGATYGAILEQHYPGRQLASLNQKLFIPAINGSLSKEGRLAVALNWGNETSRDRILADPLRRWSEPQVRAILDTLDERDWQFVQHTWDYIGTFWPEIEAKQRRVTGVPPERVQPAEVSTRFGTFRGGYYPLAYDGRMHPRAGFHIAATEAKLATAGAYVASTTRRGHTQARLENVMLPVRLDLGVAFAHLQQVIHDLTHHETLIDTTRILRDEKVSAALFATRGDLVYQQFTSALQDVALGSTAGGGKPTALDAAATYMKTGTQIAGLGWNLWTALQQPLGVFNGMSRVGPAWVARGMGRWLRDAASMENTAAWIADVSPMMRERVTTATQDLHDLRGSLRQPGGWFDGLVRTVTADHVTQQTITDGFLWHIGIAQRVADIPTWLGGYEKAMAAGHNEARAIALADQGVLDSQGGGQIKDLAAVQRGGPVARLFMTFYSYGNMLGNATAERAGATNFRSPASILTFMGHLSLLYVLPALGTVLLSRALGKSGGDDDDLKAFLKDVGSEIGSSAMNTMVFVRELGGLVKGGARGYEGPAGTRLIQLVTQATQQVKQGEADEGLWKSLNAVAGVLFRYPSAQVQRTIDGFVALEEGRTTNPAALLVGAPPKGK